MAKNSRRGRRSASAKPKRSPNRSAQHDALQPVAPDAPTRLPRWLAAAAGLLLAVVLGALWWGRMNLANRQASLSTNTPNPSTSRSETPTAEDSATIGDPAQAGQLVSEAFVPVASRRNWSEIDDPSSDGWSSEVFNDQATRVLSQAGDQLVGSGKIIPDTLRALVTDQFTCGELVPRTPRVALEDPFLRVERGDCQPILASSDGLGNESTAAERLAAALGTLVRPFPDSVETHYKFKIFDVQPGVESVVTRVYFALSGRTADRRWEQNAAWRVRFRPISSTKSKSSSSDPLPRIESIEVEQYELVTRKDGPDVWFRECTKSILAGDPNYRSQFLVGLNERLGRIQDTRYFSSLGNPGLAIGDVNGDGLDDLYVCQESHLPNRLFLQNPDGTAEEVSVAWGVDWLENSRSALLVDLDNDGDQDLAVAVLGGLVVAENIDQQRFEVRDVLATDDDTMSLTAADYDDDGDLDLYQCVDYPNDFFSADHTLSSLGGADNRVYHDANNAGANSLFQNDHSLDTPWQFTNVTERVGLNVNNRRFSLAAAWDDYDNDGDQDLYVANDFGRNNLYRNDPAPATQDAPSRVFTDVARETEVEDSASGMSAAWGDYDRDGRMDLYVANMFSAAGGRITSQPNFKPDASGDVRSRLRRFARGSTLMRNQAEGPFSDVSDVAGVAVGRWAWGSNFADINNDGWPDLVVANGYITADDTGDL